MAYKGERDAFPFYIDISIMYDFIEIIPYNLQKCFIFNKAKKKRGTGPLFNFT